MGDGAGATAAAAFGFTGDGAGRATWGYWTKVLFPWLGLGAVYCIDCIDVDAVAGAEVRLLLPATETAGWAPYWVEL